MTGPFQLVGMIGLLVAAGQAVEQRGLARIGIADQRRQAAWRMQVDDGLVHATRTQAASAPYPDPSDKTGKLHAIDVTPVKQMKSPVTLAAVKADKAFASFPLVRISRLSVMPVTDDEWKRIEAIAH